MKRLILVLILVCASTALLNADVYIKEKIQTDAYKLWGVDQPQRTEYAEQWIGEKVFAHNTYSMEHNKKILKKGIIINLEKEVMMIINHTTKTFIRTNLPINTAKILPAETAEYLSTLKLTAKVTPNGRTERKEKWVCMGYDVIMLVNSKDKIKLNMTTWSSTDIPLDWKTYHQQIFPTFKRASALQLPITDEVIEELKKMQGYPITSTITTTIGKATINQTINVVQLEDLEPTPDTYQTPNDYTEKKELSRTDLMNK